MIDPSVLRLVAITDSLRDGIDGLSARAASAVRGGATTIQLRLQDETPRVLVEVARALRAAVPDVPLIVNDRADVAMAAGAQGVHVGADGVSAIALRRIVPATFVIGVSVSTPDEVARSSGADYVAIGPVLVAGAQAEGDGALGVEGFAMLARQCRLPAVAIGGVSVRNAGALVAAGASGVAVISALFGSTDPADAARLLRAALDASER